MKLASKFGLWGLIIACWWVKPGLNYAGTVLEPKAVEWILEGNRYCEQGEYEKGVEMYKLALENYHVPDAAYNLGVTYELNLHNAERAKYYYQRFLDLEPEGGDAAQVSQWLKELKIAYPQMSTLSPANTEPHRKRPRKLEDLSDAERDQVINTLKQGQQFFLQKKYPEAAQQYEKVLDFYESPDAYYNLGTIYGLKLNDKAKAINYLKKFCLLEPNSQDASQVRKWISQLEQELATEKNSASSPTP